MKNKEQVILLCIGVLCAGLMVGILIGRITNDRSVRLSAYDNMVADQPTANIPYRDETTGKININTASAEELTQLPGIGTTYAERIVEHREKYGPFLRIDEIKNIKGISDSRYEKIKNYITVGG